MSGEFWESRPNLIESDKGFSVEILGQTGLRYVEGGRAIFVDSEALATPGSMSLYRGSLENWDAPDESDVLAEDDRERIICNIQLAFESLGYKLQVI
jgi:hypothetical protein